LAAELVQAPAERQEALIEKLRDAQGLGHTEALASAIPQLAGAAKGKGREALAERLTRMTRPTLRDKLHDENLEIRRAAALACAMKEEKKLVADLIPLLEDPELHVVLAAAVALRKLTGQDFGPAADASPAERAKDLAKWKDWWAKQTGSRSGADQSRADPSRADKEKLRGTWTILALERSGKRMPRNLLPSSVVQFDLVGEKLTFDYAGFTGPGTCTLDPTKKPKEMDMVSEEEETSRAIYSLEGATLKICGVPEGEERPKAFTTKPGTSQILFVLNRKSP